MAIAQFKKELDEQKHPCYLEVSEALNELRYLPKIELVYSYDEKISQVAQDVASLIQIMQITHRQSQAHNHR